MEKNFLILVEGQKDCNYIAKKFQENFEELLKHKFLDILGDKKVSKYLSLLKINLKKDLTIINNLNIDNPQNTITLSFDSVNKDFQKHEINIYIKRATSQNIDKFTEVILENASLKKYYDIEKELTYSYSIFDYDPGRTNIELQVKKYFNLKNQAENLYPIIDYPCIEGQDFHYNYTEIIKNYDEILKNDSLNLLVEKLEENIKINNDLFYLKEEKDISSFFKKIHIQIMRIIKENLPNSKERIENYVSYLEKSLNETDNIEILETQKELYSDYIKKDEEFILISFIFSVFENICDWIIEED